MFYLLVKPSVLKYFKITSVMVEDIINKTFNKFKILDCNLDIFPVVSKLGADIYLNTKYN
jgi:hypothetical protein